MHALEPVIYVAEGASVALTLHAVVIENGAAAAGQPVLWSGQSGLLPDAAGSLTGADGDAAMTFHVGPLSAGQSIAAQACAWQTVCAAYAAEGVSADSLMLQIASGAGQSVSGSQVAQRVSAQVTDGQGNAVAGAAVSVYQTVTAVGSACPASGRCPAQPVLLSRVDVLTSDAEGMVWIQPLQVSGLSAQTQMLFSAGTHAAAGAVVNIQP